MPCSLLAEGSHMSAVVEAIKKFVAYYRTLSGDEKGEAQVFCERLFQAFGHGGYKEAGATLEYRVKNKKETKYADLLWRPRLLLEMKKRGEKLQQHYSQAFEYWLQLVPNRPKFVVLCNFDEFWIYDLDQQLNDPVDKLKTTDLPDRYTAFNFLLPVEKPPQFGNDLVAVTRNAADKLARVFNLLVKRREDRERAQRFVLQCVMAMFAEDTDLLPKGMFTALVNECLKGGSSYDLIGGLFRQMNTSTEARGGRFKEVPYFNGGVFKKIDPIELNKEELALLLGAAKENWGKVQPHIFGTLFQSSMGKKERHALGAHFTSEADIQKVILPTIIRPWRARIEAAKSLKDHKMLLAEIRKFRVLDPACGSGNFLYVAYRELRRLELDLMAKSHRLFKTAKDDIGTHPYVSTNQFYGIDKNEFAVELARVTLMLAKELSLNEAQDWITASQLLIPFEFDAALPLDNLDVNIKCEDALFCEWPQAEAIVGNPPYQSKNKAQAEIGRGELLKVRSRYPAVSGKADYCVYWFRKAHDALPSGGRAGLVGTNTIRQNKSREGGLDYIVQNGGTITEAVSSEAWSGDAAVYVSIVNWVKGDEPGKKKLFHQEGEKEDGWSVVELDVIGRSLTAKFDVTTAKKLQANADSKCCYQGQTHGHEGFLLTIDQAKNWIAEKKEYASILHRFAIGDDLLGHIPPAPSRYAIDFCPLDVNDAGQFTKAFKRVQTEVLPDRETAAEKEKKENEAARTEDPDARLNWHHRNFLNHWWWFSYARTELMKRLNGLPRYIACVRVTKRPIFVFLDVKVHPNDSLQVFPLSDDYSFGILQSGIHWEWFTERCSTLKGDPRYTSDSVFDSFPWPQEPTLMQVQAVARAAVAVRGVRETLFQKNQDLRAMYRGLELPGSNPLRDANYALDKAVRAAFGMRAKEDPLCFLLALNGELAAKEDEGEEIVGPGLPPVAEKAKGLISTDCIGP